MIRKVYWDMNSGKFESLVVQSVHPFRPCLYGFHYLIRESGTGILCAYIEIPKGHPYYGKLPQDIEPLEGAHGGLTYSGDGKDIQLSSEKDSWFLGWDYGHYDEPLSPPIYADAEEDCWDVIQELRERNYAGCKSDK